MSGKVLLEFLENRRQHDDDSVDQSEVPKGETALDLLTAEELKQTTHQMTPMDSSQVRNYAGGFVFKVDEITRVRRFLILGVEGGTYYVKEMELAVDNAKFIINMIEEAVMLE
ncbi:unnamed protein product [Soboliphyme baturini]|uniref:TROVE domain-containing protein n=1 Tax=Soboliphyme baturini TaxID=241478 RepID=A0A183JB44_9BILA|nr:unnamed protein product [Soboliphyme baturini]